MKLVILAGGSGTRLWPVSRHDQPKQIKPIVGNKTLLVTTYERLRKYFRAKDIYISTNINQLDAIKKQLPNFPQKNYIIEPSKRDTASAIGLAATYLSKNNPKEIFININSDHFIKNEKEYARIIRVAGQSVEKNRNVGVLIGVKPSYAETGLGYIRMGGQFMQIGKTEIFEADEFKEKPDKKTAESYIKKWEYLWNIGCFVWRVDTLLDLYKKYLPHTHRGLMNIKRSIGTSNEKKILKSEFAKFEAISIDYAIIEKYKNLVVVPADFGWADIGNWGTVKDILSARPGNSVKKGKIVDVESTNNLVYNYTDKLITMLGVKNMIIIETEESLLLCPKDKAADIKKIIKKLKTDKYKKYL